MLCSISPEAASGQRRLMPGNREKAYDLAVVLPSWHRLAPPPPFWQGVLDELTGLGVEVHVIPAAIHPLRRQGQPPPSRRAVLPSPALALDIVRSRASTVLCVEYSVATAVCLVLARLTRKRSIVFQEHLGREGIPLPDWERRYRKVLAALADALIANTDAAYAEIAQDLGVGRLRLYKATLLVPPDQKDLRTEVRASPRPKRRPVFLFVGGLVRRKNVDGLLSAAAALHAHNLNFEVWIAGDGPERSALETHAADLISRGVVRFLGIWPNRAIGALYEAADVFVMPSLRDYRSVAVLEALRFGKPVILSNRDGNARDGVREGETGLIFDPEEPGELTDAMETLILRPDLMVEMGTRAAAALKNETPKVAAARLHEILIQVGGARRR